jgi:hypothetical protein
MKPLAARACARPLTAPSTMTLLEQPNRGGFPLLTSVSPAHDEAWRQFTKREFAVFPADPAAIDLWRRAAQTVAQANRREERRAP